MEYKKPERTAIKAWRLRRLITLLLFILAFAGAVTLTFLSSTNEFHICLIISIITGLLAIYKLAGLFLYPIIEYKQWKYFISDEKIEIVHGIFYVKRDIIPQVRVQNITVKQGPIYRRYDLYAVEIALASGTFEILGLSRETADEIAERVREKLSIRLRQRGEM